MTVVNAVGNALTGSTGSGKFAGETSAVLVTPTLGAATATSLTFSPTTGGIVGTTTNDNAGAGKVGEFISSNIASGSPLSLSNNTPANLTSISLTAGDWDVWGNANFGNSGTASYFDVAINTTSATLPDSSLVGGISSATFSFTGGPGLAAPYQRMSLSGTTTVYLVVQAGFNTGAVTAIGGIYARRAR